MKTGLLTIFKMPFLVEKLKTVKLGEIAIKVFLVWFVIAFLIFPNLNLLISVFYKEGIFSTEVFQKLFSSARAMRSLSNSFLLAVSLSISVNIVGTLLVLFTEYFNIKGAKILKAGYMTTLIYGGVVLATGYKFIYGENGLITRLLVALFTQPRPRLVHGLFCGVVHHDLCLHLQPYYLLTRMRCGASITSSLKRPKPRRFVLDDHFPNYHPIIETYLLAITILIFLTGLGAMSACTDFGDFTFQTINPMIMTFAQSTYSREIGALLAMILGIATILLLTVMNKLEKGGTYISVAKTKSKMVKQKINSPIANGLAHGLAYLLFLVYVTPHPTGGDLLFHEVNQYYQRGSILPRFHS